MVRSMTGYARSTTTIGNETVTIETTSVNHRYLDCTFRMPNQWAMAEPALRDIIKKHVTRGKIHVSVRYGRGSGNAQPVRLDAERAQQYIDYARELTHLMRSTESLSLNTLITLDGVMTTAEEEPDLEETQRLLGEALEEAMTALDEMRAKEGAAMRDALLQHLDVLERLAAKIAERAPEMLQAYEERLRQRIEEINAEINVKEERLALEVAMMADRADVTEELVRLKAHIVHGREILVNGGPIGRDLNFLAQEMQREVNTLGAKMRGLETGRDILEMKTEIEKIREQLQNIE